MIKKDKNLTLGFLCWFRSITLLTNSYIESLKSPRLSTVEVTYNMDSLVGPHFLIEKRVYGISNTIQEQEPLKVLVA